MKTHLPSDEAAVDAATSGTGVGFGSATATWPRWSANGVYFANVASGGLGAQVTVGTNPQLKKAMGGGAYALTGIITAAKMEPYAARFTSADEMAEDAIIVLAVGNARQAGGGFQVTRDAYLDDGLMDVMAITDFQTKELGLVIQELQDFTNTENTFVHYRQVP